MATRDENHEASSAQWQALERWMRKWAQGLPNMNPAEVVREARRKIEYEGSRRRHVMAGDMYWVNEYFVREMANTLRINMIDQLVFDKAKP